MADTTSENRVASERSHVSNPGRAAGLAYPADLTEFLNPEQAKQAFDTVSAWPGYAPTPLHKLDGLAAAVGVGEVWYKDESHRFGLDSFKALGGAYAVAQVLARKLREQHHDPRITLTDLRSANFAEDISKVTVSCATDGNHGRAVAWGAKTYGCSANIFVHANVTKDRIAAMERFGANVVQIEGNYDESVRYAAEQASANSWIVVSDTAYEGYTTIPGDVMHGYTVMVAELLEQLADHRPTHVVVPGGVGGVAAAVTAACWWHYGTELPRIVVVEPDNAACLMESAHYQSRRALVGDIETVMAGLSCGEPSLTAWPILQAGASDFVVVSDAAACEAMRTMAEGMGSDSPVVSGESAASVVACLQQAAAQPQLSSDLGFDQESSVLLIGTEGATDPSVYLDVVGKTAEQVVPAA